MVALIAVLVLTIIREFLEMVKVGWHYLKFYENYCQLINVCLTIAFIAIAPYNSFVANHFGSWAVFAAWINLTNFIGISNFLGLARYLIVAFDVLVGVFKMFLVFMPSFLAFVFSFYMMLKGSQEFHELPKSMMKTFVMMTGEFEYGDLFSINRVREIGGSNGSTQV